MRNNFFVVIHQVNPRTRNLCSKPGLSDSRPQARNFWAVLPLLYPGQGHENKEQNRHQTCPGEHLILTYVSFSFLCAA